MGGRHLNYIMEKIKILIIIIFSLLILTNCKNELFVIKENHINKNAKSIINQNKEKSTIEMQYLRYEMLDINFDHIKDLIIYFDGTGFGSKIFCNVYKFDSLTQQYIYFDQLSNLTNPSFLLSDSIISSFYIGATSGTGEILKWDNNSWVKIKQYNFETIDSLMMNKMRVLIEDLKTNSSEIKYIDSFVIPDSTIIPNYY
jgi:hypothetical protein